MELLTICNIVLFHCWWSTFLCSHVRSVRIFWTLDKSRIHINHKI